MPVRARRFKRRLRNRPAIPTFALQYRITI
jgi:hypothetical protein